MKTEPANEVRVIRQSLSAECGDDLARILEYYRRHQEESKNSGALHFVDSLSSATSEHNRSSA